MKTIPDNDFFDKIQTYVMDALVHPNIKLRTEKIDWKELFSNCYSQILSFFENTKTEDLIANNIQEIGGIAFAWNSFEGNITIDFSGDNNIDTAFEEGFIMAETALDLDWFFQKYFEVSGDTSFKKIDGDYTSIIRLFELVINKLIPEITKTVAFLAMPLKLPCHIAFSYFDDEPAEIFYTVNTKN